MKKQVSETVRLGDADYILIGIFEIKKERRKPIYLYKGGGGKRPITTFDENPEQYTEHYGATSEIRLLNENYKIHSITSDIVYNDGSILPEYEGVYILKEDFLNNKNTLKNLKVKYVDKTIGIINNDPQFYTTLFCLLGIVIVFLLICFSH
ncbi:hypothetical protein REC12_13765 [Desulfosporosinus sp. PR]|uniref:hypothetical protein n=1 Tax=Candidatus Desulfosporosinus nitrosoreducens TaxID=3401928 RepID=UPI0027EE1BA8|nr:hypothetical protein [Desulfosporosinus sp. PR]MDQ7094658.1 hypothetical protein [Desulfosporosinus sp. PR]